MTRKLKSVAVHDRLAVSVTLMALVVLTVASPGVAGTLAVTESAKNNGTYGLEVTVTTCAGAQDLNLSGTISADETACDTISTGDPTTVSGTVTLTAGTSISFGNGFSVTSGSDFTAAIDATLTPFAWVQDDSPANETTYSAEFSVNADNLTIASGEVLKHFVAYSGGTEQLQVLIDSGKNVLLKVRRDNGTYASSTSLPLAAGWNEIDVTWEAAASASASLAVNNGGPATVTAIDNDTGRIASVRWGAVGGTVDSTSGFMYLDDFTSWR
jgi:hypothetical protein